MQEISGLQHQQHLQQPQLQQQQQQQNNQNDQAPLSHPPPPSLSIPQQYHHQQQQQQQQPQSKQSQSFASSKAPPKHHQSCITTTTANATIPISTSNSTTTTTTTSSKSVSILVYKTLNTVFKSSRKIIVRVCEVASTKKSYKMFNLYSSMKTARGEGSDNSKSVDNTTGHDRFCQTRLKNRTSYRKKPQGPNVRRTNSANEFDAQTLTAANRRQIFSRNKSASSEIDPSDQSEHSEKSPLVSARLDNLARIFFSKSMPAYTGSRDTIDSELTTRPNLKYQYSALDSGNGVQERSPRERAARERALNACREWMEKTNGRYDVIGHLDEIGSRHSKNWFLISDSTVRTDRLMTLLPLPPDCIALEELPPSETPKGILMELLGSLHHPYIYPTLDLGFLHTGSINYACLVTPFNPRGSLKDLIFKSQWNEPWNRKYTRKPTCLPASQVQRLGRQILEALLFLKERGFPLHGHLHSGNVILQNGVARLSGLENGLLGISSRINAIMWSRSTIDIENIDIICFGHLLYEMCTGQEMTTPKPSMRVLEMDLDRYPQILEILSMIFDPPNGVCPTVEDLVLCDLFRGIDLRELRGACFNQIKPSLSKSTVNLLHAVKRRQTSSVGSSFSEASSPCTPPSTPRNHRRAGRIDSFDISSDSEGVLDEVIVTSSSYDSHQQYDPLDSPIHFCDNSLLSDDTNPNTTLSNSGCPSIYGNVSCVGGNNSGGNGSGDGGGGGISGCTSGIIGCKSSGGNVGHFSQLSASTSSSNVNGYSGATTSRAGVNCNNGNGGGSCGGSGGYDEYESSQVSGVNTLSSFNNQLTADMCNYKNSKSRRLEYSLKCLKYGRSNPSQDSAFGSLTDGDLSIGSSSFRLSSFQSITSPIDEGVEDIIIATTSACNEISIELSTTMGQQQQQQQPPQEQQTSTVTNVPIDSALSTPCREESPNFLSIDEISRSQYSLQLTSPKKIQYHTSSSTSNLQFDPPKILVNDQNSIYTTSPSKRSNTIEVFSQKYRVSSFEDMSPNKRNTLKSVNRMAFRSLEEERRIDSAFMPITDRTKSENRVNINSEKYKKLTHTSFRISNSNNPERCTSSCSNGYNRDRHTLWKDSAFYRKTKIAKSNDSLLIDSPNYSNSKLASMSSLLLSPHDNHYDSQGNHKNTNNPLNRGKSVTEIASNGRAGNGRHNDENRWYRSAKSEDLIDVTADDDDIRINDTRKSRSERHLLSLSKLKQTTILPDCFSEDDTYLHDNNKISLSLSATTINQKIKKVRPKILLAPSMNTTTPTTIKCRMAESVIDIRTTCNDDEFFFNNHYNNDVVDDDDDDDDSSTEASPLHQDMCKIFDGMKDAHNTCTEEKTPLLDSVEMSPISPNEPEIPQCDTRIFN